MSWLRPGVKWLDACSWLTHLNKRVWTLTSRDVRQELIYIEEVHFKDGYAHGPTIGYFPDGTTPQLEDIWYNNKIYSHKQWDINGNLEAESKTTYEGGVIYTKIIKIWNASGTLLYHAKKVEDKQYNTTTTVFFGTNPWT